VAVKQSNDVTRLQALVDKKRVVVTEATIRDALHLDDAEGVDCLPNDKIFTTLARMGYEKPSTKLTFYKAFFSSQWKFLIHMILQSMSAKRTSWNEFSSAMASAVICLSTGRTFNLSKVGKGCSGVETPLFKGMLVAREPENQGDADNRRIESPDDTILEDVSNQGRMLDESDKDKDAKLMNEKEE
nr:synaptobrevin, longin-like domain protein [Tanacetum cinerariifolium]